jgi:hypothetical protein
MTTEPEYRRATCFVCGATCEQRRRSVLFPDGSRRSALDCLECEAVYVIGEPPPPAAPTTEEQPQP